MKYLIIFIAILPITFENVYFAASAAQKTEEFNSILMKNEEFDSIVTTALFGKLNWIVKGMQDISQQFTDLSKRLHSLEYKRKANLLALKTEIRELLQQQNLKTEELVWQMKQELLENFEFQQELLHNTSMNMENLKTCDITSLKQNRNWQTILRRQDGSQNFNRSWHDYKTGFGTTNGEFFIGLEKLHAITTYNDPQELLIILGDFDNQTRYAKYSEFAIGSESEKYKIKKIGKYQGDAGDSFSQHFNHSFSTYDQDNDSTITLHCAKIFHGGWWFSNCYNSHLTGPYLRHPNIVKEKEKGLVWHSWHDWHYSLKYAEMLIRTK